MSWEIILGIAGTILPYVVWIETRMITMADRINSKTSSDDVKELIDLKQEKLTERLDNLKEDMKEIKEKLDRIAQQPRN